MIRLKYVITFCVLLMTLCVRGQQVEIRYEGDKPLWISELRAFCWDKLELLHFENAKAVYNVSKAPKIFRLATSSGFSSLFIVGEYDRIEVDVIQYDPLKIEIKGDFSGMYYKQFDEVAQSYFDEKLKLSDEYMAAFQNNDEGKFRYIEEKLEKMRKKRNAAYWRVFKGAVKAKRINDVLVTANIPLALKKEMFHVLKKNGGEGIDELEKMLNLYTAVYFPTYVYNTFFYPYTWVEVPNALGLDRGGLEKLMAAVMEDLEKTYFYAACNNARSPEVLEDLSSSYKLTRYEYCVGYCMELDEVSRKDTLLNSLFQKMERSYLTRKGVVLQDFSTITSTGKKLRLKDYRGKYVLLDFWASWCRPCKNIMPDIKALYHKYQPTGKFDVLGVSKDEDRQKWLDAIKTEKLEWNHILFSEVKLLDDQQFSSITSLPQLILIDPKGKVILNVSGSDKMLEMTRTIEALLK